MSLRGKVPWAGEEAEMTAARHRDTVLTGGRRQPRDLEPEDFRCPDARVLFESDDPLRGTEDENTKPRTVRLARSEVADYGEFLKGPVADTHWDADTRTLRWVPLRAGRRAAIEAGMLVLGALCGIIAMVSLDKVGWEGLVVAGVGGAILWAGGAGDIVTHTSSPLKLLAGAAAVAGAIGALYPGDALLPIVYGVTALVGFEILWLVLGIVVGQSVGGPSDSIGISIIVMCGAVLYHGLRGSVAAVMWMVAIGGGWALIRWSVQLAMGKDRTSYIPLLAAMPGGIAGVLLSV